MGGDYQTSGISQNQVKFQDELGPRYSASCDTEGAIQQFGMLPKIASQVSMFVRDVYLFLTFELANTHFESNVNFPQIRLHPEAEADMVDL